MLKKIGRLGIFVGVVLLALLAVIWQILYNSEVGMAKDIGIQDLPATDYSSVPGSVIDSAVETASDLVGNSQDKLQALVDQMLATYEEAKNSDVVVVFNSGGWGWNRTDETPGWGSILNGIQIELESQGYRPLVFNYRRTSGGIMGCIREFIEAARRYPNRAKELALRVQFLTQTIPGLKVIVAGESTGTVISDKTMNILKNDPQVYSIQTGTPFWHKPTELDRTLLMNSNGRGIDTFSHGHIPQMVWATVKGWFGLTSPDENPGNILSWLKAPGHDYSWQYPGVSSEVIKFLQGNFGEKDNSG
jgi:hypothetical protein